MVSVPFILADFPSGVCSVLVPLATHPPPLDSISNSSWPTDLPSRRIFSLPFSCVKMEGPEVFFFAGAAERREATAKIRKTSFQRMKPGSGIEEGFLRSATANTGVPPVEMTDRGFLVRGRNLKLTWWRGILSHLRVADSRQLDALRIRCLKSREWRGGGFRRQPQPHRRNCPRENQRVDKTANAARAGRGNWFRRGRAGGRSWSCSERAGRR